MSKYDNFWTRIQGELESAIQKSLQTGSETTLEVIGLTDQGNRGTWYARGIIGAYNPDNMSHGTALANCLMSYAREHRLIVDYAVSKTGREVQLTARCTDSIPLTQPTHPRPAQIKLPLVCKNITPPPIPVIAENPPIQTQHPQSQETKTTKILEGKTLIILPCCKSKKANKPYPASLPPVPNEFIRILTLISKRRPCVNTGEIEAPALWLYTGRLYNKLDRILLHNAILEGWLDIVILSGGYGMTHVYEKIHNYEAEMPDWFDYWKMANLPNALKTYIENTRPNNVIAFFSNNANGQDSYGGIYCQGAGKIKVPGALGKYVANKTDIKEDGSGKANISLRDLVMKVVRTKTLIEDDDIPFKPPCWFSPS